MKLRIDYDGPDNSQGDKRIAGALKQHATMELINAYPAGEHFQMVDDRAKVTITFTVVKKTPANDPQAQQAQS